MPPDADFAQAAQSAPVFHIPDCSFPHAMTPSPRVILNITLADLGSIMRMLDAASFQDVSTQDNETVDDLFAELADFLDTQAAGWNG